MHAERHFNQVSKMFGVLAECTCMPMVEYVGTGSPAPLICEGKLATFGCPVGKYVWVRFNEFGVVMRF